MDRPPDFFYRVQHEGSSTRYKLTHGFESREHYRMTTAYWLNTQRLTDDCRKLYDPETVFRDSHGQKLRGSSSGQKAFRRSGDPENGNRA